MAIKKLENLCSEVTETRRSISEDLTNGYHENLEARCSFSTFLYNFILNLAQVQRMLKFKLYLTFGEAIINAYL